MNQSLANKLVLCDLDNLLLGPDGNLTQVVRDVLQLFSSRGGRFTVFSQRTPKAVRTLLGSVRLSAPALVCGGTLAYHFADGSRQPLCSFAGQDAGLFALTVHAFRLFAWSFLLAGFNIFTSGFFTALNNGAVSAAISFLRTLVFQVAAILLLPRWLDINGIWLAVTAAESLTLLVTVSLLAAKRRKYHY